MLEKTVHLNEDILKGVSYRAKMEDVDESTAIRQFIISIFNYPAEELEEDVENIRRSFKIIWRTWKGIRNELENTFVQDIRWKMDTDE